MSNEFQLNDIGILDPDGLNPNPLTGQPYSDTYKKIASIWSNLPAYENAKEMIQKIRTHQVTLIISGTGSGKTVLIPKFVLHAFHYKGKIAITLPKQTSAYDAANFASKTLDVQLGKHVGYQYKGCNKGSQ